MSPVDAYFKKIRPEEKAELEKIRKIVHEIVSDVEEAVSYGMPAFKYKEKYLVGFFVYKDHLSLFPTPGPIEELKDELNEFKLAKGTIQFTLEKPLTESLIKGIVESRVREIDNE